MKEKMICRGDLFYCDFRDNSGSVQSGERPVLVIQATIITRMLQRLSLQRLQV